MLSLKQGRVIAFAVAALFLGTAAAINVNSQPLGQGPFSDASASERPKAGEHTALVQEGGGREPTSAPTTPATVCDCLIEYQSLMPKIKIVDGSGDYSRAVDAFFLWQPYGIGIEMLPVGFDNSTASAATKSDQGSTSDPTRIGSLY